MMLSCFVTWYQSLFYFSEKLSFPNNDLTDESVDSIVKILSGTNNIQSLDMTNNQIGCSGAKRIAEFLSVAPKGSLDFLNLSLNNLRMDGCESLCKVIISDSCSYPKYLPK